MSKVASPSEAAALVRDGSTLGLGGFAVTRNVIALAHELIRAERHDLTLVQVTGGMDTDLLVGAGCVKRLVYSGGSLDRFGYLYAVNDAARSGLISMAEYSSLSLALRLHAGAMGLPYLPTHSLLGSELLERLVKSGDAIRSEDPFTGLPVVNLAPITPDVAIIHVDKADERGNASMNGPAWTMRETAFASKIVILLCEHVVPVGSIDPNLVKIPGVIVNAVVPLERGAHPTAVLDHYDFDRTHLVEYVSYARRGTEGVREYLDRYVYGVADHTEYLMRATGS